MDAPVCRHQEPFDLETGVSVEARPIHNTDADGNVVEEDGLPIITDDRELLKRGICHRTLACPIDCIIESIIETPKRSAFTTRHRNRCPLTAPSTTLE